MRIVLVGNFPLNPTSFDGGVLTSTANLIEGLTSLANMDVHFVTTDSSLTEPVCVERDDVTYHYLPSQARLQTLTLYRADRKRIQRTLEQIKPEVVHAQNSQNYGFICLQLGYPTVISVHGIVQEEAKYLNLYSDRMRAVIRSKLVQRYCIKTAQHIIQPTRYPEQYFRNLKSGKFHDTGNPIAEKFFNVDNASQNGRLLYSGAIIRRKRLSDLIKALAQVKEKAPSVTLRVAGSTPDATYLQEIKQSIVAHGLTENVSFLGLLTPAELIEEYSKCTTLILPSGQETSPMVVMEMMAVGKPVIATNVGGVPFLVEDGQAGFVVDVGDIDTMAARILTLLSDESLAKEMGKRAKDKANRSFRSRVVAEKVRQVYREAIESF